VLRVAAASPKSFVALGPGEERIETDRALIAARWRETARTDPPALITQAGAISRPILERLGLRRVGRVEVLLDEFGHRRRAPAGASHRAPAVQAGGVTPGRPR